uniref:Homeobox domain-containing protein n=1 Tax=Timema monikensis TaxID=170555 RepID=A0A7R9E9C1_9NEOP|nr:unnamed protein product [Timema monikensis]
MLLTRFLTSQVGRLAHSTQVEHPTAITLNLPIFKINTRIQTFLLTPSLVADSSESGSHKGRESGRSGGSNKTSGDGKPTRVRTVLNEKQLHTLRTCYNANPRPDALMKEQLVEMTQLSPRVIRVWFQNKRCKDKKKAILMKQQMQQEKVRPPLHPRFRKIRVSRPLTVNPPDSVELEPLNGGQIASSVALVVPP